MTRGKRILVDANIIINLIKLQKFSLLEKIAIHYEWQLYITEEIKKECKDRITRSMINQYLQHRKISILVENNKDITLFLKDLNKRMELGAEVELFAIAKVKNCNILADDRKNTNIYFTNYPRGEFWVYNLDHFFYLAVKARLITVTEVNSLIAESIRVKHRYWDQLIVQYGFEKYCQIIDENVDKHIDPNDISKFCL